ncbi:hypothetical protein [Cellulomonas composti]|uniref:Uncharacterized protein n=1 Tax=Cellulomonas composti TaxID=266130 RepID=A0A511JA31_9CELL|nr:hypothetical protein [Cellulomonas composti]GEL94856.1 hypothetical protein CCO02nite_15140 [Cellulomonas composti]
MTTCDEARRRAGSRRRSRANPAWHSLSGRHVHLSEGNELARRYLSDVSVFAAVRSCHEPGVLDAVVDLVGPGAVFPYSGSFPDLPSGWAVDWQGEGVQLVETPVLETRPDDDAVLLGADDVTQSRRWTILECSRHGGRLQTLRLVLRVLHPAFGEWFGRCHLHPR